MRNPYLRLQFVTASLRKFTFGYWVMTTIIFTTVPVFAGVSQSAWVHQFSPFRASTALALFWNFWNRWALFKNVTDPSPGVSYWTNDQLRQPLGCSYAIAQPLIMLACLLLVVPGPVPQPFQSAAWWTVGAFAVATAVHQFFAIEIIRVRLLRQTERLDWMTSVDDVMGHNG